MARSELLEVWKLARDQSACFLSFADGTEGEVDLAGELWGEVFEPLRDPALFRRFQLDRELNTLTWPTGADLAPEFLYERTRGNG